MLDVAVLVSGGGTNLEAILTAIEQGEITNAKVKIVISNNKRAFGLQRAQNHGIEAMAISPKDCCSREEFYNKLTQILVDKQVGLVVLAGFLVQIPEQMIKAFPNKIINIHPSLVPSFCGKGYYGLGVHEKALARGVKVTGATVHFVDNGTDTGPILYQKAVEVKVGDTPEQLQQRVMEQAEWKLLPKAINEIANDRVRIVNGQVRIKEAK